MEFTNYPPDWADRVKHLTEVHKFGECNRKGFYRGDRFAQHMRHSHAATRGPWNKVLERVSLREKGDAETEGNQ